MRPSILLIVLLALSGATALPATTTEIGTTVAGLGMGILAVLLMIVGITPREERKYSYYDDENRRVTIRYKEPYY